MWRDVPGYAGYYQVSNTGRVKSLDRIENWSGFKRPRKGRVLKLRVDKYGYNTVLLMRDGKAKHFTVHKLVALCFIGPAEGSQQQINHKDGDKRNNSPCNLEWCSVKENVSHSWATGLSSKQCGKRHHASIPVVAIKDASRIEFDCIRACAEDLKVSVPAVWAALRRQGKTKGYSIQEA